jgi:thiol-disulfide isomerase/thioredoxin
MFNFEHQTFLLITILGILITITFFFDDLKSDCKKYKSIRPTKPIRPIKQNKPSNKSPKKIHNSEEFNEINNLLIDDKQKKLSKNIKCSKNIKNIKHPINELKNIIILFYSDNCYHCHQFFPTWLRIKENINGTKIKLDEVNCTNNDPGLDYVDGYPTIAIYDQNNNYIMSYDSDRSYENFKQFLENL